ncbi:transglutaminase-like domain-containing protein [Uliginosibacterium gangwonense]|uniref:transglutaminase-like domain-containing protein n=1 Tax=Uliginosibacterium gangwonense TaxID=392736 RepID=UPI001B7FA4FA|nr:transglutaminase family protein [Uliginosibacterium gangwonense]
MKLVMQHELQAYLLPDPVIDFTHPTIQAKAQELRQYGSSPEKLAKACFEFVRDQIAHSWDARQGPLTLRASEVLTTGFGYCYAKSHLLAALLRANGIHAGLCYQRFAVGEHGAPYCLHGLNAILLPNFGWYRVDARGNKAGIDARFAPPTEYLAFALQDAAERDFPAIYAHPLPIIVEALSHHADIFSLHDNLPDMAEMPIDP